MKKLLLIALLFATPVFAQDSRPVDSTDQVEEKAQTNDGYVNLRAGVDFTTQYFARGNLQENQGVIGQPWITAELHLYKDPGGWISDVHIFAGTWNSLHSGPTGTGSNLSSSPSSWYENQFTTGLSVQTLDLLAVSGGYTITISPNDRFDTIQEVFLRGAVTDKSLWDLKGDWWEFDGLRIFGGFAWETRGQRDDGLNLGVYAEVGMKPGVTLSCEETFGDWSLSLSVPLTVGFNIFEYYEVSQKGDQPFGFMDLGVEAEIPIACLDSRYGTWSVYGAFHWIYLDQNLTRFNGGEKNEIYGTGGVRFSY